MKKTINYFFASALLCTAVTLGSCSKDDDDDPVLPPIGGFNSSNDVASANRIAYWSFDGTYNEAGGAAPQASLRASFVTGIKGQGVKLDSGFIRYPTIAALNAINGSVTVSSWIKTQNQGAGSGPTGVFALALAGAAQGDWNVGPINMFLENGRPTSYNDTLVLKGTMSTYRTGTRLGGDNINDFGIRGTDFKTVLGANKWVHYVYRWDGTGSFLDLFANGVLVSNNNFRFRTSGNPPVGHGAMTLPAGAQTQVLIGGFPNANTGFSASPAQGWQAMYRGDIDQIRVYNKSLTDAEIMALYQLELAGR